MVFKKFKVKSMSLRAIYFFVLSISFIFIFSQITLAYSEGAYGNCSFSENCSDSADTSTVISVPPSKSNPSKGRVFSVNLKDGQIFSQNNYKVAITPNFSSSQINKVNLYQDGSEVGSTNSIIGESYQIDWPVPRTGNYQLKVRMYLKDGGIIEQVFNVKTDKTNLSMTNFAQDGEKPKYSQNTLIGKTPKVVAYLMPYGLIFAISLILVILLIQTRNQLRHIMAMLELLKKDKVLFEEKANFIKLISHHIRTPMTILKGGIESYFFSQSIPENKLLSGSVNELSLQTENLLNEAQQNVHLQGLSQTSTDVAISSVYKSWKSISPAIVSVILLFLLNYVFINAGKTQLLVPNILLQVVLMAALFLGILVFMQRRQNNLIQSKHLEMQNKYQLELDKSRNSFIKNAANKITPLLITAKKACQESIPLAQREGIDVAFSRLGSLIERFNLASELEKGKIESAFSMVRPETLIESVMSANQQEISTKNLKMSVSKNNIELMQNEYLLLFVISVLIGNAVRYAAKNTKVEAKVRQLRNDEFTFTFRDKGLALDESKIESLFKPFSRAEEAIQFDQQGEGINLYLSRLISRYLGGDLNLKSTAKQETWAVLTVPNRSD